MREKDRDSSASAKDGGTLLKKPGKASTRIKPTRSVKSKYRSEELWASGAVLLNKYRVIRKLGQGGMGAVYLVSQRVDDRPFAVKVLPPGSIITEENRRVFIREIRTWIDIPAHPCLVTCRFFKTINERLALFLDYIDGGSLQTRIADRSLISMKGILDTAIQFASGVHAAHRQSVIHQDVKPANVLLTSEGIAKVSDFGLANASHLTGDCSGPESGTPLVSVNGMTAAYCSPEQSASEPLDHRTDIWSFGVSILEMFTGPARWKFGMAAPHILDTLDTVRQAGYPDMPDDVKDVLKKCFHTDADGRWQSMQEISDSFQEIYRITIGAPYPRHLPTGELKTADAMPVLDRITITGTVWDDPEVWLLKAWKASGKNLGDMQKEIPGKTGSHNAQRLNDLEVYQKAEVLFNLLEKDTPGNWTSDLAQIRLKKGLILSDIKDLPGAISEYDKAIAAFEKIPVSSVTLQESIDFIRTLRSKGIAHYDLNDFCASQTSYSRAIELINTRDDHYSGMAQRPLKASLFVNLGNALFRSGDFEQAAKSYETGVQIYESLPDLPDQPTLSNDLAIVYQTQSIVVSHLGDVERGFQLCDRSISLREKLVFEDGHKQFKNALSSSYKNKAVLYWQQGEYEKAGRLFEESIRLLEDLVLNDNRQEFREFLADSYLNLASTHYAMKQCEKAGKLFEKTIELLESMALREGRNELLPALAHAYMNAAVNLDGMEQYRDALAYHEKSKEIYTHLIEEEHVPVMRENLALVHQNLALVLHHLSRYDEAVNSCNQSIKLLDELICSGERKDLAGDLGMARLAKVRILAHAGHLAEASALWEETAPFMKKEIERTGSDSYKKVLGAANKALVDHGIVIDE